MGQGDKNVVLLGSASLMCQVSPHEQLLLSYVESAARAADRPDRPLHLQALLQVPRVADAHGFVPIQLIEQLLPALAQELPVRAEWFVRGAGISPRGLRFHEVEPSRAREVMLRFHYLRSPRTDGRVYGLTTPANDLVALCVTSPLDVESLRDLLVSSGHQAGVTRVISRVFAFPGAPRNSISFLLSRAAREESLLGVTDFVTYVNPNMGFTGSSYRASGWHLLGIEPGTKYRYLDDRYITDRELHAKCGMQDDTAYRSMLGDRFAVSVMPLDPLLVFGMSLKSYVGARVQR